MTDDITALRAALAAATPGPWFKRGSLGPASNESLKGPMVIERANGSSLAHMTGWRTDQQIADAAYIAACSPDRIARLLDRLEAAERDAARYRWLRDEATAHEMPKVTAPHSRWLLIGAELDAAIDAAMQHTEGEK